MLMQSTALTSSASVALVWPERSCWTTSVCWGPEKTPAPGELVLAAVVFLVGGALFGVGRRLSTRHRAVAPTQASTHGSRPWEFLLMDPAGGGDRRPQR
jgi:hypothetical protein